MDSSRKVRYPYDSYFHICTGTVLLGRVLRSWHVCVNVSYPIPILCPIYYSIKTGGSDTLLPGGMTLWVCGQRRPCGAISLGIRDNGLGIDVGMLYYAFLKLVYYYKNKLDHFVQIRKYPDIFYLDFCRSKFTCE